MLVHRCPLSMFFVIHRFPFPNPVFVRQSCCFRCHPARLPPAHPTAVPPPCIFVSLLSLRLPLSAPLPCPRPTVNGDDWLRPPDPIRLVGRVPIRLRLLSSWRSTRTRRSSTGAVTCQVSGQQHNESSTWTDPAHCPSVPHCACACACAG